MPPQNTNQIPEPSPMRMEGVPEGSGLTGVVQDVGHAARIVTEAAGTSLRLVVEGTTRSPAGVLCTKRVTATVSTVDNQPKDVAAFFDVLRSHLPTGLLALDVHEELLPVSVDNAQHVPTDAIVAQSSLEEADLEPNVDSVLSDDDDDSTDMEIDSVVEEFVEGVLKGLKEAEERRAQLRAQRKQAKVSNRVAANKTPVVDDTHKNSNSDEPEELVAPLNTGLPKKPYDVSDDELLADIVALLGEDPAVDKSAGGPAESRADRPKRSSRQKCGETLSKKASKRGLEVDKSNGKCFVRKFASQSKRARLALELSAGIDPAEHAAVETHVQSTSAVGDVRLLSSDNSVTEMPVFSPKPANQPVTNKKKREPVRVKKILEDKDLSRESQQALKQEQERKVRLEKLPTYEGGILDQFEEEGIAFQVEVHPELWNKLEEHQKGGVEFMYRNVIESYEHSRTEPFGGCILAHSMGLGKTVQVISLLQPVLSNEALNLETCLVLCPASTVDNWENEVNHWMKGLPTALTIKSCTLTGQKTPGKRLRLLEGWIRDGGILIVSYAMYHTLCKMPQFHRYLQDPGPDIVVCDEAHELKNSKSARTIAVSEIATNARIALTGTPLQNNLDEYFTMVDFIKPSLLGTRKEFRNRFSVPIKTGSRLNASAAAKKTMQKRSYVLREHLSACLELKGVSILMERLPPKMEHVLRLRPTPQQEALYLAFTGQAHLQQGHVREQMLSCTKSVQLISFNPRCVQKDQDNERRKAQKNYRKKHPKKQRNEEEEREIDPAADVEGADDMVACRPYFEGLLPEGEQLDVALGAKTAILHEIIVQCVTNDEKLLIFSDRRVVMSVVEELLTAIGQENLLSNSGLPITMQRGINYLTLNGSVPQAERPALIDRFNKSRKCYVFLLSIKAAGQGINLTAANRVVLLEPMWNPTVDRQALFRTYRYGQTKPVHVYRLLTAGMCEEKVFEVQVDKQSMFNRILEEKHAKGSKDMGADFLNYTEHPYLVPFVPTVPPSDRIVRGLLDKFPEAIIKVENFDSLLEPVEQPLTREEQLVAWEEIEIEERNKSGPLHPAFDRKRAVAKISTANVSPVPHSIEDAGSSRDLVTDQTEKLRPAKKKRKQTSNDSNMDMKKPRSILEKVTSIAKTFPLHEHHVEHADYLAASFDAANTPNTSRGPVIHADTLPYPPGLANSASPPTGRTGTGLDAVSASLESQTVMDIPRQHLDRPCGQLASPDKSDSQNAASSRLATDKQLNLMDEPQLLHPWHYESWSNPLPTDPRDCELYSELLYDTVPNHANKKDFVIRVRDLEYTLNQSEADAALKEIEGYRCVRIPPAGKPDKKRKGVLLFAVFGSIKGSRLAAKLLWTRYSRQRWDPSHKDDRPNIKWAESGFQEKSGCLL